MKNIILASNSPRRKELLQMINIPFEVDVANIEETYPDNLLPSEVPAYLATLKATVIAKKHPFDIVIGADTIVLCENIILGKPKNDEDAKNMLKTLANKTHEVITGVTIINNGLCDTFSSSTKVTFYPLSNQEINDYVNTKEPFDKAGSYAIQGLGSKFIKEIQGDYYTVVGLPIALIYQKLKHYFK